MRPVLIFIVALVLAGCSGSRFVEGTVLSKQESQLFRQAVDDIAKGDFASFSGRSESTLVLQLKPIFPAMRRELPQGPLRLTCLGATKSIAGQESLAEAIYEVEGSESWATIRSTIRVSNGQPRIAGIYVQKSTVSARSMNEFRFKDGKSGGWLMLGAMAGSLAVTIAALIKIWRSGLFSRRWLWTMGTLIGLTTLRLNWTTGAWSFQPIAFQLFSVSALKWPVFEPWVLGLSIPVFAIIALLRRKGSVGNANQR